MILNVLWSKEEGIHDSNLAFQIYLDLYTVADLTFDPVLETRYVDEKLIFLAILHYINRRIRSAFSKYFLLCSRKLMCLNQGSDWWSEQRFKRYSHFKFWTNILTLGRKLYENPTIYMQYGYDGFKISINIKVNHYSLKRSYRRKIVK